MLVVIDVGNTHTVIGVFDKDKLVQDWRIRTEEDHTVDEYGLLLSSLFFSSRIALRDVRDIKDIAVSCVVPPLLSTIEELCKKYFNIKPLIIEPGVKTGMPIFYDNPKEVGADRIVNAVAAYEKYKKSLIIVDFGTAITFDYISNNGEYIGGVISPGVIISSEALFERASRLPHVELTKPKTVIGKDTISSMQSGIIFGYGCLVDGIVKKIKDEVKTNPKVIATGGLAFLFASVSESIEEIDEYLTLKGLRILHERNRQ
jgi:type III pantothenate kinase